MLVIYKPWSVNIEELKHSDGLFKTILSIYYDSIMFPGKIRAEILKVKFHDGSVNLSNASNFIGVANVNPTTDRINVELEQAAEEVHSSETSHILTCQ